MGKTYEVEFTVPSFCYTIANAGSQDEAIETAKRLMFDDIVSCPNAIISDTKIIEVKRGGKRGRTKI